VSVANIIKVAITGESAGLKEAVRGANESLGKLDHKSEESGGNLSNFASKFVGVGAGIGVAVAAVSVAVHAGDELNESQEQLAHTVENVHGNVKQAADAVAAAVPHFENFGVTQKDLTDSATAFLRIGDSVPKAMTDAQHAADLAAAAHISYADASKLVINADEGKFRGIQKYLGPIKSASDLTRAYTKIQGDAQVASGSLAGKTAALKARFSDITAHVGQALIPILLSLATFIVDKVIPAVGTIATWIQTKMVPALVAFGQRTAELYNKYVAPTVKAIVASFKGVIQALAGILDLIRDVFTGKWSKIGADLRRIVGGIVGAIFGQFQALFASVGRLAENGAIQLLGVIRSIPGRIIGLQLFFLRAAESLGKAIVHGIVTALGNGATLLVGFGSDLVHGIIQGIKNAAGDLGGALTGILSHLPGAGLLHKAHIPGFANGGFVPGPAGMPQLAFVHGGELVLNPRQQAALGGSGGDVYVSMPGPVNPNAVQLAQSRYNKRNGIR
jgi:hypothetical protein